MYVITAQTSRIPIIRHRWNLIRIVMLFSTVVLRFYSDHWKVVEKGDVWYKGALQNYSKGSVSMIRLKYRSPRIVHFWLLIFWLWSYGFTKFDITLLLYIAGREWGKREKLAVLFEFNVVLLFTKVFFAFIYIENVLSHYFARLSRLNNSLTPP